MHRLFCWISIVIATSMTSTFPVIAPAPAEPTTPGQNVTAVYGVVTGNVQNVGFRAMIQNQAIQYNLAGSAKNDNDNSVRFILQGPKDRIDQALKAVSKGTKKSSN